MKTLLKILFLATAISCTANVLADNNVIVAFYKADPDPNAKDDGAPIANGSVLNTAQDFFVAIINSNPTMNDAIVFHASDPVIGGPDIQTPNWPASVTFVHPSYEFDSCYETSYASAYQPTQPVDPANPGFLGADGNRSFCLVRLHYTPSGTPATLTVSAQSPMGGISTNWSTATLNLA